MKKVNGLLLGLSAILVPQQACALRLETARIIAGGAGIASLVGGLVCTRDKSIGSVLLTTLFGAGMGALTYLILGRYTPEGRIARAQDKLLAIERNSLVTREYNDMQMFFNAVQESYITDDYWLINAYHTMSNLLDNARDACMEIEKARSEALDNYVLVQQSNIMLPRARLFVSRLMEIIKSLREHPKYDEQLKEYKKMLEHREKMQLQRERVQVEREKVWARYNTANR